MYPIAVSVYFSILLIKTIKMTFASKKYIKTIFKS